MARWLCSPTMFSEVFLSPCCDFHYSSIPVCDAVPSKGPKITASSMVFRPWPLRTEIVPYSLKSLDDIMHCRWMITSNSLQFFSEKLLSDIAPLFSPQHWGNWWSSSHLDFWETLPLWEAFLYPIMLPIDLISCKLVLQLFLTVHLTFPASYCYLSQLFWNV